MPRVRCIAIPSRGWAAWPLPISYLVAYVLVRPEEGSPLAQQLSLVWRLLPGAALAFGIGLLDDLFNLRAWIKLVRTTCGGGLGLCGRRAHPVDRRRSHGRLVERPADYSLAAGLYERLQPGGRAGRFGRGVGCSLR
jgi:hypothetical protein